MSGDLLAELVEAELALVSRDVAIPVAPFGYGSDLSCTEDLGATMETVDPFSTRGIAEAIVRRLGTPRGGLPDDPDYGFDLRSFCNRGITLAERATIEAQTRAEITKDDRIDAADVSAAAGLDGRSLRVSIFVRPFGSAGPFSLVLAVSDAGVLLEELGR